MNWTHQTTKLSCAGALLGLGLICGAGEFLTAQSTHAYSAATSMQLESSPANTIALRYGEVAISGENGQFTGKVLVNAPSETVWKVLTDYDNFYRFMPNVEKSQLLSTKGNQKVFEQVNVFRIFAFTKRSRVHIAATESYPQQIAFRVIKGDVGSLKGAWKLTTHGNQSLITHQVAVSPSGQSNRGLFYNIYKNNLKSTLAAIRSESERRSR